MKKQLIALSLFALALGVWQLPAQADINLSFGQHDRDHDGRWNYNEFRDANRDYYRHHHEVRVISGRQCRDDFNRLDADHDGYVNAEQVRTYHNW
jgi:Ca2+-binding EF-hand superfamily protein